MRWLAFGTYDVQKHPRVAVLLEGLRAHGDEVAEINAPLPLDTAGRVRMLRQPWRLPELAVKVGRCWATLTVETRRALLEQRPDAVLVGYLGHFDVRLARRLFGRTPIALDHLVSASGTARDRGLAGSGGIKAGLLRAIDDGALRRADVVLVDTEEHRRALPADAAAKAVVAPVGATRAWFDEGGRAVALAARPGGRKSAAGPLRVVFVGLFTPLHGTAALGAALAALAGDDRIEVTMVGTGQDHARCRELAAANTRVTWLDWVSGEELPALVAGHDVSLGIFGTTDKALAVVPTKVYQGAAAGCAIVTSDTAPQRAALGNAARYVPPGDGAALARTLRALAADRAAVRTLKAAARERAVTRFTAGAVVAALRDRLAELPVDHSGRIRPATDHPTTDRPATTRVSAREGTSPMTQPDPPLAPRARLRWMAVEPVVQDLAPADVLELGCGLGGVGVRLAKMTPSYTTAEPDDECWQVAYDRITPLGGLVVHGDHNKVPSGAQYDLVCAFEVLEHIADDAAALADWVPLVRPGGHLLLSVPADPERFGPSDEAAGHYRRYSTEELGRRLAEAGSVDIKLRRYAWPLGYVLDDVRDWLVTRRQPRSMEDSAEQRTSGSGRLFQPQSRLVDTVIRAGVAPFALLQDTRPASGPGLLALARRPA